MFSRDASGRALLGGAPIDRLIDAAGCGTPAYLYDLDAMAAEARALAAGFGDQAHLVAYAVKACSAGSVVRALAAAGCGADVVSGPELAVALGAGVPPGAVVWSGVAKRGDEIDAAIGAGPDGILAIQAESVEEIHRVAARARACGRRARVSLRVNPGVEVDTHAHVATGHDEAKFGVPIGDLHEAEDVVRRAPELRLVGLSTHVGSMLRDTAPYLQAARALFGFARAREAAAGPLEILDVGGGFAIDYGDGPPTPPAEFAREAVAALREAGLGHARLVVEPGRALVAPFGVLVASTIQPKVSRATGRRWLVVDAGMSDLIRPALYQARHRIEPLDAPPGGRRTTWRVVGPCCESADDFGDHDLPDPPPAKVVVRDAGAYGFTMASHYNGRALPAEVFVSGGRVAGVSSRTPDGAWAAARLRA